MAFVIRNIPPDVLQILLNEQYRRKQELGVMQYSVERTILYIIKEYAKCAQIEESYVREKTEA